MGEWVSAGASVVGELVVEAIPVVKKRKANNKINPFEICSQKDA